MAPSSDHQDRRVWIGGISEDVRESDIRDIFGRYGEIAHVDYIQKKGEASYAFVQYKDLDSVEDVLSKKDRISIGNGNVKIGRANPSKNERKPYSVTASAADTPAKKSYYDDWNNSKDYSKSTYNNYSNDYSSSWKNSDWKDYSNTDNKKSYEKESRVSRKVSRSRTRSPPAASKEYQVTISNLPGDMTWQELKRLGGDYGKSVAFARTIRSGDGMSGLVSFTDKRDAKSFIDSLDGKKMEGCEKRLRLDLDEGKREKDYSSRGDDRRHRRTARSESSSSRSRSRGGHRSTRRH